MIWNPKAANLRRQSNYFNLSHVWSSYDVEETVSEFFFSFGEHDTHLQPAIDLGRDCFESIPKRKAHSRKEICLVPDHHPIVTPTS
jgi:hypothetical protein